MMGSVARLLCIAVISTAIGVVLMQSQGIEWLETAWDPVIFEQPHNPTVYDPDKALSEGIKYANLTCRAIGRPYPKYTWTKDNTEVDLASGKYTIAGGFLIIYNPRYPDDEGVYQCIAYNEHGADVSVPANFRMAHVGAFDKTARSPVTVTEGRGFKLECGGPDAYPALHYGWYKGVVANRIIPNERIYISHQNGDLYFKYSRVSDTGNYRCFVQNQLSTDFFGDIDNRSSPAIAVTVNRDLNPPIKPREPVIMLNPADIVPIEGYTAELECFDDAYPASDIRWKRLDRPAREGGVEIQFPARARFNSHSHALIIPEASEEDGGIFQCTASNEKGSVSHEGKIEVKVPPKPLVRDSEKPLLVGGTEVFSCESEGSEPLVYSWYFGRDKIVTDNVKYIVATDKLTVKNLDLNDEGSYRCIITNDWGVNATEIRLTVRVPNIKKPIGQQNGMEGSDIIMKLEWEAAPAPTMDWIKQSEVIASMTPEGVITTSSSKYNITKEGYLIIRNLAPEDAGSYSFRIQNVYGSVDTAGRLYIAQQSRIIQGRGPTDVNMEQGGTVTIPCEGQIDSLLESVNTWYVDGRRIDFEKESFNYKRGPKGELIIMNANVMMHDGVYTCGLDTSSDEQSATARVRIKGVSEAPVGVKFENVGSNTATLRFTQANTNGDNCKEYVVEAQTEFDDIFFTDRLWTQVWRGSPNSLRNARNGGRTLTLNNLKPNTEYSFRVMCMNSYGMGEPSFPTERNRTLPGAPSRAPGKLGYGNGMEGDVLMSWEPLQESDWGADTIGYRVRYRRQGTGGSFKTVYIDNPEAAAYAHTQPPAPINVPYECKIAAYNNYSVGPEASWIAYSSSGLPDYPRNLVIIDAMNDTVTMQWDKIPNFNGPIPFWGVRYWREQDRPRAARRAKRALWWDTWLRYIPEEEEEDETGFKYARLYDDGITKVPGPSNKETYILRQLQPSTLYNFQVRAYSHPYFGEYSNITRATTMGTINPWLVGLQGSWWMPMLFWFLVALLIALLLTLCCCCCLWCKRRRRRRPKSEAFTMYERNGRPSNFGVDVMTPYHKGRLKKLRDTIIRYVSPDPVADHLVEREVLPQAMAGQIKQIEEPDLANERLLDILPNRPDHAFDHFCDGVRPEHPWLSDLLEEEVPEMTDVHKSTLESYREPLAATVDPHPVINHMRINEYFNPMEAKHLESIPTREEANHVVIDMVKDRPDPAFYHYLACVNQQNPSLAAEMGGPDYQKEMKLHLENGTMARPRMFAHGQYDGDLSGKDAMGRGKESGSDMPMLNSVNELKMSNMVAVEPVETKMTKMDVVDAPKMSSGLDGYMDLHKSGSQHLDPNMLGRASGPVRGSGLGVDVNITREGHPDIHAQQVMQPGEEMDVEAPEVHPFEAQSGSTIEVENSQPVIIEIIGDAKRVRWLYEGAPLPNNDFYRQYTEGEDINSLFIAEVNRQNQGCYTCEGTTGSSVVNCDIFIKVREPQAQIV
ncbi:PREDICTED: contactin-2-like isoform X2 [Branchiostoma belcheri]|uniref:Contactin-2-like isoform X2 n=1 Tax=Branchiostoma belcheri TaxID=7741 RepID=A0A6P5A403_BRABE|nr:PREDICTED: contactin-2-like isoform X2 [Branchiostoma belcheri]